MVKIGAHVSIAKGLILALDKAKTMGATCIQIFSSSPRSLAVPLLPQEKLEQFKTEAAKRGMGPNFIHASYLINLGSDNAGLLKQSIAKLTADLIFAHYGGFAGVIVHTGSHTGRGFDAIVPIVTEAVKEAIKNAPGKSMLYLEIAAGGKGKIGSNFEELQTLLTSINNSRVGIVIDTAHLFAGGIKFDTSQTLDNLAQKIETTVGWNSIGCIHANDSKGEFGSFIDRHENIGKGKIGLEAFRLLLAHKKFSQIPFVLEVPGFDDKGPDKQNIAILKSLL